MGRTAKHEEKEKQLVHKGFEILWNKGFNGTSVNDIVKAAGIPKGSFYFYFDSKEDFVIKAIHQYFKEQYYPSIMILQDQSLSAKDRLMKFYEERVEMAKNDQFCKQGCMFSNISSEISGQNDKVREEITKIYNYAIKYVIDTAKEAQKDGDLDASLNIPDMITFFEDAFRGALITMKEKQSTYPVDNVHNMLKRMLK
ncbi:MAG: TetR/AcrR family transcriptional regulator [Bacteroidota bacterium]